MRLTTIFLHGHTYISPVCSCIQAALVALDVPQFPFPFLSPYAVGNCVFRVHRKAKDAVICRLETLSPNSGLSVVCSLSGKLYVGDSQCEQPAC